jgi:hypothetical protein
MNVIVWYFDLHLLVQPVPVTMGALVEQELHTLPEHQGSPRVLSAYTLLDL